MSDQTTTDGPPRFPTASCESCFAPIIWAVTKNAQRMPVDAEPVDPNNGGGNVLLEERGGTAPLATVVGNAVQLFGKKWVWRPHMATCPYAERYRSKARNRTSGGGKRGWVRP